MNKFTHELVLSYNTSYVNPLTGRVGQYRVITCCKIKHNPKYKFVVGTGTLIIVINSPKVYNKGCVVNPTKVLKMTFKESNKKV